MTGPFSFLSSFGPLSVISSQSGLEMLMIYPKKIPGANPYTCLLIELLFAVTLWSAFGSVRGGFFLYPFPGFIWVSTGLFFPFFPFFTLLSQYTLLLATAVAYPYLFLASLLILLPSHFSLFPSAYTMHLSYLPTNSFILSPNFNEQPSFILWGHPSPFPFSHCK